MKPRRSVARSRTQPGSSSPLWDALRPGGFVGAAALITSLWLGRSGEAAADNTAPPSPPQPAPSATPAAPHAPGGAAPAPYQKAPKAPGVVKMKRGSKTVTITLRKDGKVPPEALEALSEVLKHKSGAKHAVPAALADLLATVSDHFGGRTLEIVAGYRPPPGHSNHNTGKAVDFKVEGVPAEVLRDFCQTLPGAGVGFYPKPKFVHLDVRAHARNWTDDTAGSSSPAAKPPPKP